MTTEQMNRAAKIAASFLDSMSLDALRERAYLNTLRGIRVSPELQAEIVKRERALVAAK